MREKKAVAALINIFNPLLFAESADELAATDLVRLLCAPYAEGSNRLIERSRRISAAAFEPPIVPRPPILVDRIVSPLVRAKVELIAGHPLRTIALCGFAAEMIALILHEIGRDEGLVVGVSQEEFERHGQQRRVRILWQQNVIDRSMKEIFDFIRDTRRKYLHFISQDYSCIFEDALQTYSKAVSLLVRLVGQNFEDGAWVPEPSFERYLRKYGIL